MLNEIAIRAVKLEMVRSTEHNKEVIAALTKRVVAAGEDFVQSAGAQPPFAKSPQW